MCDSYLKTQQSDKGVEALPILDNIETRENVADEGI